MAPKNDVSQFLARSFSQDGEDRIVVRLFRHRRNGFYIDIGAHHPHRFSNTALLHEMGWRGINIDATPGSMDAFAEARPQDINLWTAVADQEGTIPFKVFGEGAYNSLAVNRVAPGRGGPDQGQVVDVPCAPIDTLLLRHLPADQKVDFVSMDVEGFEMTVLGRYPFDTHAPAVIVVEDHGFDIANCARSKVYQLLTGKGYRLRCHMLFSSVYVIEEALKQPA
ncbi:FkbM family methyltransferase [Roseomonas sp. CAU 1739]|uniref:FkbM family methyltransferase n=1 Tax=Roseomonas sp. CAU 1739 TaxID=3140364 RepID=UPI00325C1A59